MRYFVRIVELGGMGKAALELDVATSALSQQINRLEAELGVRLLVRHQNGSVPTEAGSAFYRRAQLALRHADEAAREALRSRLSGAVSVGLPSSAAAVLGGPLLQAMGERYPDLRLHLVESFSGFLSRMLKARQLDLAVLFESEVASRWHVTPLLEESLYAICSPSSPHAFAGASIRLADLAGVPLILPSRSHGMRHLLDAAFSKQGCVPTVAAEIDSLGMLLEAVRQGLGVTIQAGAVANLAPVSGLGFAQLGGVPGLRNLLVSLPNDEVSPAAEAARTVVRDVATRLVKEKKWIGALLSDA
ncbi:tricarballylate utilization LysR family transcriptional regulator TcuR [Pigmentiphaga soli]|uniref:Tricarballylate utilization LysR family transcriptional regulator TcuR n=2 Tax=Pigmentiphaga soli TaxID=1007095 RepID=A0ABP8GBV5_9BURK